MINNWMIYYVLYEPHGCVIIDVLLQDLTYVQNRYIRLKVGQILIASCIKRHGANLRYPARSCTLDVFLGSRAIHSKFYKGIREPEHSENMYIYDGQRTFYGIVYTSSLTMTENTTSVNFHKDFITEVKIHEASSNSVDLDDVHELRSVQYRKIQRKIGQ